MLHECEVLLHVMKLPHVASSFAYISGFHAVWRVWMWAQTFALFGSGTSKTSLPSHSSWNTVPTDERSLVWSLSAVKRFRTSGPVCTHSCVVFHFPSLVSMADRQRLPRQVGEDGTDRFSPINNILTYSILNLIYSQSTTNVPPHPR